MLRIHLWVNAGNVLTVALCQGGLGEGEQSAGERGEGERKREGGRREEEGRRGGGGGGAKRRMTEEGNGKGREGIWKENMEGRYIMEERGE